MVKIHTSDIRIIFNKIIDKLESQSIKEIDIEMDYYRFIPSDRWQEFDQEVIEIGSLLDDIESLKLLISDSQRPCTYVDLDRMSSLLRAISQKYNPI